ncbi:myosin light chain kinase [Pelomyxa schiedti]|nr:myosin light chain kinase [Pelomyxa schiedti]
MSGVDETTRPVMVVASTRSSSVYHLLRVIGRGSHARVFYAEVEGTREVVAVKVVEKAKLFNGKQKTNLIREVEIMRSVVHPNVLSLIDLIEDTNNIYMVTPHMGGGELFNKIISRGHFTEADAVSIVKQICEAINFLHRQGICHRDLKPENILCSEEPVNFRVVISDFGLSKLFGRGELMKTACGTLQYAAPEVFTSRVYSEACDMWTLGVITYVILTGCFPFNGTYEDLMAKMSQPNYVKDNLTPVGVSLPAVAFIEGLLQVEASNRLHANNALSHPWLLANLSGSSGVSLRQSVDLLRQNRN